MNNTVSLSLLELQTLVNESPKSFGDIDCDYMVKINEVIQCALIDYSSIFAFRVDLRFASLKAGCPDSPVCIQNVDGQVMKRFIASFQSQLNAYDARRIRTGIRVHPTKLRYVWVCEQNKAELPHYHLIIVLNKAAYWRLNNFNSSESFAGKIQKAWCSALSLDYPAFGKLVHFPKNCEYVLTREEAKHRAPSFMGLMCRVSYLAKLRTKIRGGGRRCIGYSWG